MRRVLIVPVMCEEDYTPRMPVARLATLAAERLRELQSNGAELCPVVNKSRKLATNYWGAAWMRHLARCEAGGLNLAPGRSLLRHGSVLDLRLSQGKIAALVSADELYEVELSITPLDDERLEHLKKACYGNIASCVALLEGKVDADVLNMLCADETGVLPEPADWHMYCSCTDWSEPCAHAAAAVYAAGCLIDAEPGLLFTLRGIDVSALLPSEQPLQLASDASFDAAALSATFGIDIDVN